MRKLLLLFTLMLLFSCDKILGDGTDKVFNVIGLNSNKIPSSFERHFKEIRNKCEIGKLEIPKGEGKDFRMEKVKTYQEYMEYHYGRMFDNDMEEVNKLQNTDEIKPMKTAAIEMYEFADKIYKEDFMMLAKKPDNGANWDEIEPEVRQLDNTKGFELDQKREKVMNMIIPYADKHGIEYKMMDTPL